LITRSTRELLNTRPSEPAFDVCWRVIHAMLAALPEDTRRGLEASLPAYATDVARVSGGLLGFRSISADEKNALDRARRA
jgi:hypothetical protein